MPTGPPTGTTIPTKTPTVAADDLLKQLLPLITGGAPARAQVPTRQATDTGAVGNSLAPGAFQQPAYVNQYTGQTMNAPATTGGGTPTGGYTPLVSPLATSLFFQSTIAPMLKQIQETGDKDTNSALGEVAAKMKGLNLPPEIAAIYANRLPRETEQYGDLNAMLAQSAVMGPVYDQLMNQLAATQKQSLQQYNLEAYNAAAGAGTTTSNQAPPAGAKPGGQWVNGVYIPPA